MKKMLQFIAVAIVLSLAGIGLSQPTNEEKVVCELASKNCLNQADILQRRIKKLNAEIRKGQKAYSAEELKKLEQKLQEAKDILDKLEGKK